MSTPRYSPAGFTLVEIMVVIAVIIVVAAIGVPGIMRQRVNANEAAAVAALKTLSAASVTYRATHTAYPANLSDLYDSDGAQYIDSTLASGIRQGYNFTLQGDEDGFNVTASPSKPNITGTRYFMIDFYGVIRASGTGPADESSPAI
ncbi:MAG: prepilin-type N-terminal cleavage/methylation domain-containing protein [Candidatus Omnitrophica bacterium]|nr:prepilin-type N-terminal cleavage/methylation domain-containing protein [Candidatus Omnitrophota bacterium]MDD5573897.1 prepilin-type N-terminal cleavage/methylation domain-containing protein [Candidatus Omnitrophota bacterium]